MFFSKTQHIAQCTVHQETPLCLLDDAVSQNSNPAFYAMLRRNFFLEA